jgi:Tfp pilus assembly PilM family ATPase
MSRLISIECDPKEVRIAVGSVGLTGVVLEHVVSAPLELNEKEDLLSSQKTLGALQLLLRQIGIRSGNAVFCLGRSSIELRAMTLPSTDRNELPEMVRFAAQRQFANVGDSWPIDYVTLPSSNANATDCMVATINPSVLDRLSKMAESLGLTMTRVVLRPMTSATLAVAKRPALSAAPVLLLELFRDEADMAVLDQGHVVFMRNVRFSQPIDLVVNQGNLVSEIKRTMIAAASQRENLSIDQVRIWGPTSQHESLCQMLSTALDVNVESVDAFELLDASKAIRESAGLNSGRFASTVGALVSSQVADRLIDFSNPRKREEVKRPFVKYAIAGAAAATLLVGGYVWQSMAHAELDKEIERLNAAIARNSETLKISTKKITDWNKVEDFLEGDHQWLDELEYMSQHAANADRAIFGVTTFTTDPRTNAASISTKFVTGKQEDVPEFQDAFRDAKHQVRSTGLNKSPDKTGAFPFASDITIKLAPITVVDPRKSTKTQKQPTVPANSDKPSEQPAEKIEKNEEKVPANAEPSKEPMNQSQAAPQEPSSPETKPAAEQKPAEDPPTVGEPPKPVSEESPSSEAATKGTGA